jgi:hypothetical protein
MPIEEKNVGFTRLWDLIPKPKDRLWGSQREILELFCGALWNFEVAEKIKRFPAADMQQSYGQASILPWEDFIAEPRPISSHIEQRQLVITCASHSEDHITGMIQNVMYSNGALRLSGIWDILDKKKIADSRPVMLEPTDLLNEAGEFLSPDYPEIRRHVLIVMALRDSLMHGESPPLGGHPSPKMKKSAEFRRRWIVGNYSFKYSPSVIAEACKAVFTELIDVVKTCL